ncbi:Ig-like domain-containing protein [Acetitomaculum ruminis]|nr:Ig-like domain-containing protein [Acetitomaculum ruminis]
MKKVLALFLTLSLSLQMAFPVGSVVALAKSQGNMALGHINDGIEVKSVHEKTENNRIKAKGSVMTENVISFKASALPDTYNSLDEGKIKSTINDQGKRQICWAFSSIAAIEASMLSNSAEFSGVSPDSINLSELTLAYLVYNRNVNDPLGLTKGDYSTLNKTSFLDVGGNSIYAALALSTGEGPYNESDDPVDFSTIKDVVNYTKTADYQTLLTSLEEFSKQNAYVNKLARIKDSYWMSAVDCDEVKNAIMEYGAVDVGIYYEITNISNVYDSVNNSYFYKGDKEANHEVVIVGWDDDFPRENFVNMPEDNGAWICKNSWGTYNTDADGLFYVSYYDSAFTRENNTAVCFSMESADKYDNVYQYDGTINTSFLYKDSNAKFANIYTASSGADFEKLEAVTFALYSTNTDYSIDVYTNLLGNTPDSGTLVASANTSGTATFKGIHTITLNNPVSIEKDSKYAIVITLSKSGYKDNKVGLYADKSQNSTIITKNTVSKNQSFMYNNAHWYDLSTNGSSARIKALTNDANASLDNKAISFYLSDTEKTMEINNSFNLSIINQEPADACETYEFTSSDTTVAKVDSNGNVSAVGLGEAIITVKAVNGNIEKVCHVYVVNRILTDFKLNKESLDMLAGETFELKVSSKTPSNAGDNFVFSSSDTSVATVNEKSGLITAVTTGSATIFCMAKASGLVRSCLVTVSENVITDFTLSESDKEIDLGETFTLSIKEWTPLAAKGNYSFKSEDNTVATVTSKGLVKGTGAGTTQITVTEEKSGLEKSCNVKVSKVLITEFTLSSESKEIYTNQTFTLSVASKTPATASETFKFSSSNPSVATVDEDTGLVKGVSAGDAIITVTGQDSGLSRTCNVKVNKYELTSYDIDPTEKTIQPGETFNISIINKVPTDIKGVTFKYSSSDESVATVNANGLVTGVSNGTANIEVLYETSGIPKSCKVIVSDQLTDFKLSSESLLIKEGNKETLSIIEKIPKGIDETFTFESGDESIATVTSQGVIEAISIGTTTITVTAGTSGIPRSCEVTVIDSGKFKTLILDKTECLLAIGKAVLLNATVTPEYDTISQNKLIWESSNRNIAVVTKNTDTKSARVKGKSAGRATIFCKTSDGSKLVAKCVITIPYKITYKLNGGKNSNSNPSTYTGDEEVKLFNPTKKGYNFGGWFTSSSYKSSTKKNCIAKGSKKNIILYAKWSKVTINAASIKSAKKATKTSIDLVLKNLGGKVNYQIMYSTNAKFKSYKSLVTTKTSYTLTGLTRNSIYYIKVRGIAKDSTNKSVYGDYSAVRKVSLK